MITKEEFVERASNITSFDDLQALRKDAIDTENQYRSLFAQKRDSWEVPEIEDNDPHVFLVNVFNNNNNAAASSGGGIFYRLPTFEKDDSIPRCYPLTDKTRIQPGEKVTVADAAEFEMSFDCLTEGLLRFMDWKNVFCAGGAVAGCLAPVPDAVAARDQPSWKTRVERRKYYHDEFLPASDIDLFLYGLTEEEGREKLKEIYAAVQAANPYEIRAFRSAHAITLVSRYPFRHVQIVTRLYNSPAEVLMGFDVDSCAVAVGYDGQNVLTCPRTALAMMTQSNTIDLSRRSPSYEVRLAKYATRGFEVVVPNLQRDRIDPFLYEKRFHQTKGLSRLLLMERLQTPLERLRYRIKGQLTKQQQNSYWGIDYEIQRRIRRIAKDDRNIERAEEGLPGGGGGIGPVAGVENSDYSTIFLPWGPNWTVEKVEEIVRKKDKLLNKVEVTTKGRVRKSRRQYKVHVCAVGTIEEVIDDPFPNDPPLPTTTSAEENGTTDDELKELQELELIAVRGKLSWIVDNPGRQQIGSFNPITDNDWSEGCYISDAMESLIAAAIADDVPTITKILLNDTTTTTTTSNSTNEDDEDALAKQEALLLSRDFLGRSVLHVAALAKSVNAAKILLNHPACTAELLQAQLPDGRTALHLLAMNRCDETVKIAKCVLEKRLALAKAKLEEAKEEIGGQGVVVVAADDNNKGSPPPTEEELLAAALVDIFDIDRSDWEVKLNPLHYAVVMGHVEMVRTLLAYGCSPTKIAVHKDRNETASILALWAIYAAECVEQESDIAALEPIKNLLVDAGASTTQVDTIGTTVWHRLALSKKNASVAALQLLLENDARGLDILDKNCRTPLFVATACGNVEAIKALLKAGATACFGEDDWQGRVRQLQEATSGGRSYSGRAQVTEDLEQRRCPLFLAARMANPQVLDAFLNADPSLAQKTLRRIRHQRNKQEVIQLSLVDILNEAQATVDGCRGWEDANTAPPLEYQRRIDKALENQNHGQDPSGYSYYVWSLVAYRERETLQRFKAQMEQRTMSEGDRKSLQSDLDQIRQAMNIAIQHGAVAQQPKPGPAKPRNFGHRLADGKDWNNLLFRYYEMKSESYEQIVNGYYSMHMHLRTLNLQLLTETAQTAALEMMRSISHGDGDDSGAKAGAEIDGTTVATIIASSKLSIVDIFGTTPLFLAVKAQNVGVVKFILKTAQSQFQTYLDWQKSIQKEASAEDEEEETGGALKDQLRRLNNLDIAAGDMPKNATPTPDMLRQTLEAAEQSAENQQVEGAAIMKETTSSTVPPSQLLLQRSIVLATTPLPMLHQLKRRLHEKQPENFFEGWVDQPVRLRPIELAVLQGNLEMVQTLLQLALRVSVDDNGKGAEENDDPVDDEKEDNEDEEDEDEDYDYDDDCEDHGTGSSTQNGITATQMRSLLAGDPSRNIDLGGTTLLQLAILVDNVAIFKR